MHKTVNDIIAKKGSKKISVVTSYDYAMATLCDQVDILLVGDSAGMVMLGYENTAPVTMDEMMLFTKAVSNARENALIVADLPNKSYENEADAVANSERLIRAGADAVKLEGRLPDIIRAIIKAGNTRDGSSWAFAANCQKIHGSGKDGRCCQNLAG